MNGFKELEKAIDSKDLNCVRNLLGTMVYSCRDFSDGEFDRAVIHAEKELLIRGIHLKEGLKGTILTLGKEKGLLSDDDFSDSVFELKENFCDERIDEVKRIGRLLYGKSKTSDLSPNMSGHQQEKTISKPLIAVAAILLVALVVIILKHL